jgi:hypothetical protein
MIRMALKSAQTDGIAIEAGAAFDWTAGPSKPRAVNWDGAVLWAHRFPGWLTSLPHILSQLGVNSFWWYRFTIGFDQGRVLAILDDDLREIGRDEVSALGLKIAREFGLHRKAAR